MENNKAAERTKDGRTLLATSHEGKFALYLDSRDRYVYQLRTAENTWVGWFCSHPVWESAFSVMGGFQLAR